MMFSSRLRTIFNQAANSCQSSQNSPCSGTGRIDVNKPTSSADIQPSLKWNGWGYADTEFEIRTPDLVCVTGSRYENSGKVMPYLVAFMKEKGVPVEDRCDSVSIDNITIPEPIPNFAFLSSFESSIKTDCSSEARIRHSHGHSIQEIYALRTGNPGRVPDSVVYVTSQAEVETVIAAAVKHNAVIIPFGGGTCVSHALICSPTESRHICSLDMSKMNSINWIDFDNMTAEIQAGAVGVNIESVLKEYGLCLGHEPDSHEFSSLGGWIATRASGMKKNAYGNIEDIVVKITLVTPKGVVVNYSEAPRQSVGPDINNIALGSEGNFGIITSAVVRVRSLPEAQEFAALLFPNFENGVKFMHEVARRRIAPASIRLVDNDQFHFGAAVKPASGSWFSNEKLKKWIIAKLGFDINEMSACTLLFEGSKSEIVKQKWNVFAIAWDYGGRYVGSSAGRQGYNLTFLIAYIRDFGLSLGLLGESFESCVPWSNVVELCKRVKDRITTASAKLSVTVPPFTSCRISQTYDCGACVYFYFAIVSKGLKEPISTFSKIEDEAREEILKCGGSLSHHHGIGKIRKHFTKDALSHAAIDAIRAVKTELDPTNVFACGNTL